VAKNLNKTDFLDEVIITAKSGDGGRGCVSFRREKYIPRGGPDGGDGGFGGSIVVRAVEHLTSLYEFKYRRHFKAQNGQPGGGRNKTGRNGKDAVIEVPLGTLVYDDETGELLQDLTDERQEVLLMGGKGGWGNQHFATSTNRAPRKAQPGLPGLEKRLRLSLKHLADVGLVGLPNAGKSTLLSRLTMARPKIDSYPFTTLTPNLGVLAFDEEKTLTVADIPGLIEGAGEGRGLGHHFLKHIERTRLLLHVLDVTYEPEHDLLEDLHLLKRELEGYSPALLEKEQMIVINKIDICVEDGRSAENMVKALGEMGLEAIPVSALTGEGLDRLKKTLFNRFFIDHG
jgi:GTP-binding protein